MKEEKDIQPIDKLFRQSLEGYSPAPPASVWKRIRLQLADKKSGRGIWLFGKGGLSVISAILLVFSSWIIYKSFFADPEITRQNTSISALLTDSAKMQQHASVKNNTITDIQTNASSKSVSTADKKSGISSLGGSIYPVYPQKPSANNPANQPVTLPQTSSNVKTKISPNFPLVYNNSETSVPLRGDIPTITSKQNAEIQLAEKGFLFQATDTIDALIERSAGVVVTLGQDTRKENDIVPLTKKHNNQGTDTLDTPDIPVPSKPETKNRFAMAGIYSNIGQVLQNDRSPNLFYCGMITGGIWNTKWKAGFETGIGYSHYNDQGLYEFEFQRSDTVGYSGYTYFNPSDSSYLFVYKPNITDTLIYFDTITQTSCSYLKIPLYFSKQLFSSGKFSVGIKTGPSVEFMIGQTETKPEYQLEGSTLVNINNKSYTRLGTCWQWFVAPQLSWDITDKIRFIVEPAASFFLGNPFETYNRPPVKPYILSIHAGLFYSFQK